MAALTQSAIDALLGALTTVIQDEVQLISGVHSNMKFIKDEMDSMNGFLLHLNKMEREHDDQVRAWMKQVREVSYLAEDCVDRYKRVVDHYGARWGGGGRGCAAACPWATTVAFCLKHPKAYRQLLRLGNQIAELKARVKDVGERRQRYAVSLPTGDDAKLKVVPPPHQVEEKREGFAALLENDVVGTPAWFRQLLAAAVLAWARARARARAPAPATDPKTVPSPAPATDPTTVTPAPATDPTTAPDTTTTADPDTLGARLLAEALAAELHLHPAGAGDAAAAEDQAKPKAGMMLMRAILEKCCPPLHLHPAGAGDAAAAEDQAKAKAPPLHPGPGGAGDAAAAEDQAKANNKKEAKVADVDPDEAEAFRCTRNMFLSAMYVYPSTKLEELEKLKKRVSVDDAPGVAAKEARYQVMVFCYSLLSTQQKSCLQYLTAFLHEKEISRTSMVRRWVAEGLVGKGEGGGGSSTSTTTTPEEAGEHCFHELLLRGFVRAARRSDAGTVKSCVMDAPVRDFIKRITKSENFLAELPAHLERQLEIRRIVQSRASMPLPPPPMMVRLCNLRCCCGGGCTWLVDDQVSSEDATAKDPMDELVNYIRALPELYRLNVLDLGGCTGLRTRHLKSFADVVCLKYLSLRNTDISRLHTDHINKLALLETLDIRDTKIPARDTASIYLKRLKHLLAGRFTKSTTPPPPPAVDKASLVTVRMPDRIGSMEFMETLSHVEVSMDGAELQGVARLHRLRKLGVVVHANTSTAALLGRVLYLLAENLRSLSIWVAVAATHGGAGAGGGVLDVSSMHEMANNLALENLDIKGKMSLPSWIGRAPKLANVTLRDTEMDGGEALRRLAAVQSLSCLKISRKAFTEQVLRFKEVQFQALKFLVVEGDALIRITFHANDAAPKLEKIVWVIGEGSEIAQMYNKDLIIGIDNLTSCLKVIELRASFKLTTLSDWTKQEKQQQDTSTLSESTKQQYRIRYISSSDGQLITELPRSFYTHTTLSLPAGVIKTN